MSRGRSAVQSSGKRYAIVTPYSSEDTASLERCIASVKCQTIAADHILVADGSQQGWLEQRGVRHLVLDRIHRDYGNTPRGLGALLAAAEDYDGIGMLDADNWLEPHHVASCSRHWEADVVFSSRRMILSDGTEVSAEDGDEHVDTNCFFFHPGSYYLLTKWLQIPRSLALISDRIFYQSLRFCALRSSWTKQVTVNYNSRWKSVYEAAGRTPPPQAAKRIDPQAVFASFTAMSQATRDSFVRNFGLTLAMTDDGKLLLLRQSLVGTGTGHGKRDSTKE